MFREDWTSEDQQAFQRLAQKFNVDLESPQVTGETATFASMERAASEFGRAIAQHATEDLALQQAQLQDPITPCPDCGKECSTQTVSRDFTTENGPMELLESKCHCSACRRDFFPSTCSFGTTPTRL